MKRHEVLATAAGALLVGTGSRTGATEARWQQLLAAGKADGALNVVGAVNPAVRKVITETFLADTGIPATYEGIEANLIDARVEREAAAGKITIDALIGGSSELLNLYPKGLLAPIKPIIAMPDVEDPHKWAGDHIEFTDKDGQYLLRTVSGVYGGIIVNTKNVNPATLKTSADLLRPEYKGKIVSSPYTAGSGSGFAANVLYRLKNDYFTQLYKGQDVTFIANSRGVVEQIARGSYLLGFGTFPFEIEEFRRAGFPIAVVYLQDLPGYLSASAGSIKLVKNAPHPNAGAVFANWYCTRKVQELMMAASLDPSRRKDVNPRLVPPYTLPRPGVDYLDQHSYKFYVEERPQVIADVQRILGR